MSYLPPCREFTAQAGSGFSSRQLPKPAREPGDSPWLRPAAAAPPRVSHGVATAGAAVRRLRTAASPCELRVPNCAIDLHVCRHARLITLVRRGNIASAEGVHATCLSRSATPSSPPTMGLLGSKR